MSFAVTGISSFSRWSRIQAPAALNSRFWLPLRRASATMRSARGRRGCRERLIRSLPVALRGGEQAPHGPQHHPEVPPVVGVDDEAFADCAQERREDREIGALPWHGHEDMPKPRDDG